VEVDVHYARLCQTMEAQQIERLVVDGLTTIRNALHDDRRFREFVHGLLAFTKARRITTLLCYETPEVFGVSRFMPDAGVSSIVDNIILLNFVELGDQLHRAMTVVKARGSAHPLVTREYQIGPGGLTLTPLPDGRLPLSQPFGQYYNLVSRAPTRVPREPTRDGHGRNPDRS
jgi:circadian clock protein KaiC